MKKYDRLMDPDRDTVHDFFELTYASYFVMPRLALQSMPGDWQVRFVQLMKELEDTLEFPENYDMDYWVRMKGEGGRFKHDPLARYRNAPPLPFKKKKARAK